MATFYWTALANGQSIAFNPSVDIFIVDDASISASDVAFSGASASASPMTLTASGKSITLETALKSLTTSNLLFSDGSRYIVGDNTTGIANDDLANTLTGSNGNDSLLGLGGDDNMSGGAGNDSFSTAYTIGPYGNDTIDGGAGSDILDYSGANPATVYFATHSAFHSQGNTTLNSIETVFGTSGNDVFFGGDPAHAPDSMGNRTTERFRGEVGNDTITGGADASSIGYFFTIADYSNNASFQTINVNLATGVASDGLGGIDTLAQVDGVRGTPGNDTILGGSLSRGVNGTFFELLRGNAGNDTLNGNNANTGGLDSSTDRADYSNNTAAQAINVNLATGIGLDGLGGTDRLIDIEQVYGGAGHDTLTGGASDDQFDGGVGDDRLNGGEGSDQASYQQSTAGVTVNLSAGQITANGKTVAAGTANDGMGGLDTLISIEQVEGSDFNDYLRGGDDTTRRETFLGQAGSDTIDGGAGLQDFASYANLAVTLGPINAFLENGSGTVNDKMGGTDALINIEGLSGSTSNDTLTGGLGDQWLRGRGGSDTLNGGAGSDWVTYSSDPSGVSINLGAGVAADGWNGIGGFLAWGGTDTLIAIENAEGSDYADTFRGTGGANQFIGREGLDTVIFTGSRSAYTLSKLGLTTTVSGPDGTDTLTGIERLQFSDVLVSISRNTTTDFNGDGKSDLLIQDNTGHVQPFLMNGANFITYQDYAFGPQWEVMSATSDFNGDGKSDMLIRDDAGHVQPFLMNGANFIAYQDYAFGPQWQVVSATSDFNGDGKSDMLIRDDAGHVQPFLMNGANFIAYQDYAFGPQWQVVSATSDFNGDGKSDMLIRDDAGHVQPFLMNGTGFIAYQDYAFGPQWEVVSATSDFNGDGKSDMLIRDDAGHVQPFLMNGTGFIAYQDYAFGPQWEVVSATSDFNGDGKSDMLIRDDAGHVQPFLMNGTGFIAYQDYAFGPQWEVVSATSDFNGDGKSDMLIRDDAGHVQPFLMNGTGFIAYQDYAFGPQWEVVSATSDFNGDGKSDMLIRDDAGHVQPFLMNGVNYLEYQDYAFGTAWSVIA